MKKLFKNLSIYFAGKLNAFIDKRTINKICNDLKTKYSEKVTNQFFRPILANTLYAEHFSLRNGMQRSRKQARKDLSMVLKITRAVSERIWELRGLIGLQPMSGPVGLVYSLQYKKNDQDTTPNDDIFTRKVNLNLVTTPVVACSRKLMAGWFRDIAQDIKTSHNIDLEQEIMSALCHEIFTELYNEIVTDISNLADKVDVRTITTLDPKLIFVAINREALEIAKTTMRGTGNVILTTPTGVSVLESATRRSIGIHEYVKVSDNRSDGHVGNIVDADGAVRFKIFSTIDGPYDIADTWFIVGYRGGYEDSQVDCGYIYSPYVPVMNSGIYVSPTTFRPIDGFMTRGGKTITYDPTQVQYYRKLLVKVDL